MRRVQKVIAAYSTYIDPSDADSTVSYKIVRGVRLWGDVCLTDCNRKINWSFYNDRPPVKRSTLSSKLYKIFGLRLSPRKR